MEKEFAIIEMLGGVYEDLDIDKIEERFVRLVGDVFNFDRVALLFLKHRKELLHGKLSRGFDPSIIKKTSIPIKSDSSLVKPLVTGAPVRIAPDSHDLSIRRLGLTHSVLVPIVNKKSIPCWEIKNCNAPDCPAYGKKWLRCWLVPGTKCGNSLISEWGTQNKSAECSGCPIHEAFNIEAVEGVLVADNSVSKRPITDETAALLSIISHIVGMAINNCKVYTKTLDVATKDPLTGLHNRRFFDARLIDEVERAGRYGSGLSLIMCDIDHFKRINDNYGHPVGDNVLWFVANILRKNLRKTDVLARYGGEEFAALLINTEYEQAFSIAEKLRCSIENGLFRHLDGCLKVTLSFGVSILGNGSLTSEALIRSADTALYKAKTQGRNRVCAP
ncbi:MAG: GGDEF domain-containing protein [Nitrospiraceae bacterium]|nr:GGDEF domain-containing protein [Nitrospiraceae bacterium]